MTSKFASAMEEAVEFGKLLAEASSLGVPKLFKDDFLVTPLPCQVQCSFTDITGPQDTVTVLITKHIPQPPLDEDLCEESIADVELTGCPLKCTQVVYTGRMPNCAYLPSACPLPSNQLSMNQIHSFQQANFAHLIPLSLDEARYIASLYSLSTKTSTSLPSLWTLCVSDKRHITSIGCSYADSTLYTYTVTSDESIKTPTEDTNKKVFTTSPTSSVFSQYVIAGSLRSDEEGAGCLTVEFNWSDAERLLCPPSEAAEAVVRVSVTPGYVFSPVLTTYNELCTLLNFCRIAVGESEWPMQEGPYGSEQSLKVEGFLSEVASPLTQPLDTTVISPTADNGVFETRKDLDFCERLWMFAKDVASLESLQDTFAAVFKALLLGKVQPFIHRTSSSTLARLLQQLLQCTSTEERQSLAPRFQTLLSHSMLLRSLIEIGQEKMKRDYRAFFVGSDITTSDQLDKFFAATGLDSQLEHCHNLCKLHCVLEINTSLLSFLNLPSAVLSSLTKTALQVYREATFSKFESTPTFALPLLPYSAALKSLICLCSKLQPTLWITASTKEKTMVMYRSEPLHGQTEDIDYSHVYRVKCDFSYLGSSC